MADSKLNSINQIMDIDGSISVNTFSHHVLTTYPDVFPCKTLIDAIRYILCNNSFQGSNATLTEVQEQIFEIIEKLNTLPQIMFEYLRKHFAKHFDIDLYIIAFINEKFSIIHDDNYDKANIAYLQLNKDNTVQGPLYIKKVNEPSNDIPQIQEQQAVHCMQELIENSSMDDTSNLPNQIDLLDAKSQSRILLDQMLHQIFQLTDALPIEAHIMNETCQQFENIQFNIRQSTVPSPIRSPTTEINNIHFIDIQTDLQYQMNQKRLDVEIMLNPFAPKMYHSPTLSKPLKNTFHPRNLKEFAKSRSSPIQCIDSKQREPLNIGVPPDDGNLLYLATELHTIYGQTHRAKIIVPDHTKAEDESLINNNDLRCLKFDDCHTDDKVDLDNNRIYSKITAEERQNLMKKIRIHIINLYQRGQIDRKMVQNQDLKKFQLAFWFCILENEVYKCVSSVYQSNITSERNERTNRDNNIATKQSKKSFKKPIGVH
ncbi:unnamed protein product [Rotaria sp. Silwood1]|nr:unnamed protein product [Rotaria sp. Silwood1]